jgi:acetyl-CoA carboxylase biotin carboxylase subunit
VAERPLFRKVLIANRGEIAIRIARTLRDLGIAPVAVYSDADRGSPHVRACSEAVAVGPAPAGESYLKVERILAAARSSGADAVHPGYGFLSEDADFARAVQSAGLVWIGPPPGAMDLLGDKLSARRSVAAAGVPLVPGSGPLGDDNGAVREAERIGFPLLVKASAGGGGKGMRVVRRAADLAAALRAARSEATASFGDGTVYLERLVERPHHIEVQVLGDHHGNLVHLGERECSAQRRHQKVLEESPSPFLDPETRRAIGEVAVAAARSAGYASAGTCEFLVAPDRSYYFLEMNTRLQVEHPVTEMTAGVDLVALQVRIAAGQRLPFTQDEVRPRGHAIEARIYAEDPDRGFLPSPGDVTSLREPAGPGIRVDSGIAAGQRIPVHYDPILAKLIAWGEDRQQAIARLGRALGEYRIGGLVTNLPLFPRILADPRFCAGDYDTGILEGLKDAPAPGADVVEVAALAAALLRLRERATARPASVQAQGGWRSAARIGGLRPR